MTMIFALSLFKVPYTAYHSQSAPNLRQQQQPKKSILFIDWPLGHLLQTPTQGQKVF